MLPEVGLLLLYPCRPYDFQALLFLPCFCSSLKVQKVQKEHLIFSVYLEFLCFRLSVPLPSLYSQSSSMIRFPPTSIALSESDIEFHLRDIQIKQQLYAQGFTPKEVQRYYNERHSQVNGCDAEDDVVLALTQGSTCSQAKTQPSQGVEPDVLERDRHRTSGRSDCSLNPARRLTIFSR